MEFKTFTPLNVSSKFAICGVPLRVDSYKNCSFGCKYCFSNNRKIMEFNKTLQIANINWFEKKLNKVYKDNIYNKESFLDMLLKERITWHWGGMSDPFQPIENELHITKQMIDIANQYDISILFSTKSDNLYEADIKPELHTFQFSVTNTNNRKDIEPNVPDINKRIALYNDLKSQGFKVGIRIQPFMPDVTTTEIIDVFNDADWFTIEGIKLVPQNKEHKDEMLKILGLEKEQFVQMGLLNLKPSIRLKCYQPFIEKLESYNIPYSIADNDLHFISKGKCCCGDTLIKKSTNFNNTTLLFNKGIDYTLQDVKDNLGDFSNCKACQLFTSNRTNGCKTVDDFFTERFDKKSSPFSPKFQYTDEDKD